MITPDLPLAETIAAAVLDQIEADRSINRENLAVAILGRMMLMEARATKVAAKLTMPTTPTALNADPELATAARALVEQLASDPICVNVSGGVNDAWREVRRLLKERGT